MIWAISVVLALAGLVLLAVAASRLLGGLKQLRFGLERVQERAGELQDLQERLNATLAEAERTAAALPKK
ncbi:MULTISPECIES: hypothetical protein [Glycomyces]|jgi:NADH:ubiquinone oxidoreductase subunit H|uniref:NADH:ubiquinone oxidoreductase subunit H n=2 Tax=Glycomyces TaxID=58113 RepID=A0A9X3PKE5_9ACTN|nr:hypothetical protein [Glycomyces lechevalierae]MDA1386875.1 hypothetical protein [Glycomyces lechevalierae]MDR7336324.1 NADH:ubiquinone oxidoreductase subunit H [Glycomyces lechevalierae]